MTYHRNKSLILIGFSVVIVLVSLLASLVLVSLQGVATNARDEKRDVEIEKLSDTLRIYRSANGVYPWNAETEAENGCCLENNEEVKADLAPYISNLPEDLLYSTDPDNYCFRYKTADNGKKYKITVNYERRGYKEVTSWDVEIATTGTPITTCQELQDIDLDLSGAYYLANNINCSNTASWNDGSGFEPIGDGTDKFTGILDGQDYEITDLYINRPSIEFVGLFGYTSSISEIKNIGLKNNTITGGHSVGGLVGFNLGSITNSYATGDVNSDFSFIGGLVGYNLGSITNSYTTGDVNGFGHVGGLVGYFSSGSITNSYTTGDVNGDFAFIGGLVGRDDDGLITNSHSTGNVGGSEGVGGLVGFNHYGTTTNSYATGNITGDRNTGGLVGWNSYYGTIIDSYWDIITSETTTSAGGTGKTTTEMQQQITFIDWDFENIWKITENTTYPFFQ